MASTPTYADEKGGITEIERVDSETNQAAIDAFTYCVRLATSNHFTIEHTLTLPIV
jgi:hypothetical protein